MPERSTSARLLAADANTYVRFVPSANWNGTLAGGISFRAWDRSSGTAGGTANTSSNGGASAFSAATASAGISVNAVNDAPVGADNTVSTLEDSAYVFSGADFGFNDVDAPDSLQAVTIVSLPAAGALTLSGAAVAVNQVISVVDLNAGNLVYTPGPNGNGAGYASLTFRVNDGTVDAVAANTLTFDVTLINDGPAGMDTTVTTSEDTGYVFTTLDFGFTDPEDSPADSLNRVLITTLPGSGTLTVGGSAIVAGSYVTAAQITGGQLVYTPPANANGTGLTSFTFQVEDDGGTGNGGVDLDASPNTLTIDVTPVNDAPVGTDNTASTLEDAAYTFTGADFGFTDPDDSPADNFSAIRISTLPGAGSLTYNGVAVNAGQSITLADINAGLLMFTPAGDANGPSYATFSFQVQDDGGTLNGGVNTDVSPRTMTVDITPVNDGPTGAVSITGTVDRRPDPDGRHQQHRRCRRAGGVQLPMGALHRWRYYVEHHRRGHDSHLHSGRCRRQRADSGQRVLHRRERYGREPDQRQRRARWPTSTTRPRVRCDHRHAHRRPDPDRGHQQHRRCRRAGGLQLPVGALHRWGHHLEQHRRCHRAAPIRLGDADVNTLIRVSVSYTDGYGSAETLTSAGVGPVANLNDAPSGAVVITGSVDRRPDAHGGHQHDRRCRRAGCLQLPVGALHRRRDDLEQHRRGHRQHVYPGRCRRRHAHSGQRVATPTAGAAPRA